MYYSGDEYGSDLANTKSTDDFYTYGDQWDTDSDRDTDEDYDEDEDSYYERYPSDDYDPAGYHYDSPSLDEMPGYLA